MKIGIRKRYLAFLLLVGLLLPILTNMQVVEAKAASLGVTSQSIGLNNTCKITVQNKAKGATYSYVSSDTKIATVNKNGKVTGKAYGTARITVTQTKGKKIKKLGSVEIKVKKASLDAAVTKGVCAFTKSDGSGVFAGGRGENAVKSLASIEGLLKYQNPKASYQFASSNAELLDIDGKGKIVGAQGSGSVEISVSESYKGKTRELDSFSVLVAPDKKILAYTLENYSKIDRVQRFGYDIQGRLIRHDSYRNGFLSELWVIDYDSYGNVTFNSYWIVETNEFVTYRLEYNYADGIPVSVDIACTSPILDDKFTMSCTADESGKVTSMRSLEEDEQIRLAYDENGNLLLFQLFEKNETLYWELAYTYTKDGQIKSRRKMETVEGGSGSGPWTNTRSYEYLFDDEGYATSCCYTYETSYSYKRTEQYGVKGMELSEYFAKLRADETREYNPAAIVGRWHFVPGTDPTWPAQGVLEFTADGRVLFYDYDYSAGLDENGDYRAETEGEEMYYEVRGGELVIYEDKTRSSSFSGHYLLSGNRILYLVDVER